MSVVKVNPVQIELNNLNIMIINDKLTMPDEEVAKIKGVNNIFYDGKSFNFETKEWE